MWWKIKFSFMSSAVGDKKLIAKNTIFLYIRMFLVMCVTLYTSRVILDTLGAADYGIYDVVGGIVIMFSFLSGSLSGATSRFLAFDLGRNDMKQLAATFSASLNIHIAVAFIIVLMGELVGLYFLFYQLTIPPGRETAAFWVLQFSLITAFFNFTQFPYTATLLAHENMSIYAYFGVYEALSKLAIAYMITISPMDNLIFYGLLIMMNQVCILCFYRFYTGNKYAECRFRIIKDIDLYKKLAFYSGYDMLPSMSFVLQNQGVNILLNIFFGPVSNAARAIAFQINSALHQMANNIIQATRPQVIKIYAQEDVDGMYNLVFLATKFSYLLMLAIVIPLFFEMDTVINIWLGDGAPKQTAAFCRLILLMMLSQTIIYALNMAMHAIGKLRVFSITNSIYYLLPLVIGYMLFKMGFPDYSIFIASLVSLVIIIINILFCLYHIEQFNIRYFLKNVFIDCLIISVIAVIPSAYIVHAFPSGILRLLFTTLASEIVLIVLVWSIALDGHQRSKLTQIIKLHL